MVRLDDIDFYRGPDALGFLLQWGLLAAMQISGGGKNYAKVLNDRRGGRADARVVRVYARGLSLRVLSARIYAREQHHLMSSG